MRPSLVFVLPWLFACHDALPAALPQGSDAGVRDASNPLARWDAARPSEAAVEPEPVFEPDPEPEPAGPPSAALADLRAKDPPRFRTAALSYDPRAAASLDRIQASRLSLNERELAALGKNGFVISTRSTFPTFVYGLAQIYSEHLPLHVTADALLESVHGSYDAILSVFERKLLFGELEALLTGMRTRLPTLDAEASVKADVDVYLGVALALLKREPPTAVAGGDVALMTQLYDAAIAARGLRTFTLFGVPREDDFSQFKPRGHYTSMGAGDGRPSFASYFTASMWLGRVDLRLLETVAGKEQVFRRPQYLAMLALRDAMQDVRAHFDTIDTVITNFVGASDYMVPAQVDLLVAQLGGAKAARSASDQQVTAAIIAGDYGRQRIVSHIMYDNAAGPELANRSFALLGQRFAVDSEVFSNSTHDRVEGRLMANPLDAAYAALGNAQALSLYPAVDSTNELLPAALVQQRAFIDGQDSTFWNANLYNLWLSSLRALSPGNMDGLPELLTTEAWGRRLLNTQLGSWAELRHDTLLYVKQSYSDVPACEFPDAYVDPYPAFYRALGTYADTGLRIGALVAGMIDEGFETAEAARVENVVPYFEQLKAAMATLGEMADRELRGEPFSAAQLAFINEAVFIDRVAAGCASKEVPDGWYARLFFQPEQALEFNPTIADVHTQPGDEGGNIVGKVLHVATGYPRLMVSAVDTCTGPRAYAGITFAYHEQITTDFQRLDDAAWAKSLNGVTRPAEAPWLAPVLAR